ncbi:G/T mismatch-specific thymine DNA glycosylase isoform X4 [Monodelphis domestica]|uniref:G/T mismatch-specific thymine DNA glycosylase isoform X4 n=1 Tax=Monodelphis domestica TaxID=13616 RepID=UPI0004435905|nr:G/T mismatch-specific thymine DNA glycosylase isoform X4 [Monodelphis domestica]
MEAEDLSRYSLEQIQAFYQFPFHPMMATAPNMEFMNEQPALPEIPAPVFDPEPVQVEKGRKRRTRSSEPKKPEPKKPAASPKSAKSTKSKGKQEKITDTFKVKRKVDRFNGVSEAELLTKTLPDILTFNLDIVIIGINPGLMAAYKGHHYPGPGNHFCIYEIFSKEVFGVKVKKLEFGLQPHKVPDTETLCYVMPSSSARCAQFPRAQDKVHYYIKLRDLRDQLKGVVPNADVQEVQYTFNLQLAQEDARKMAVKEEKYDPGYEAAYGGAYCEKACDVEPCAFSLDGTGTNNAILSGEPTFGDIASDQWMTQSFTDQILPSFNPFGTPEQEGGCV